MIGGHCTVFLEEGHLIGKNTLTEVNCMLSMINEIKVWL